MNENLLKLIISIILVMIVSCDEPETIVTNIINRDGSVTRRIEMKNDKKEFSKSDFQVPLDSTWNIIDSIEVSGMDDTVWVMRAEKVFINADEITLSYKNDSGYNRNILRRAEFRKKFMWFNTVYRFSEIIGKSMQFGYPVKDFMNEEELEWFYSPYDINELMLDGIDSLKYKAIKDSVEIKEEEWMIRSLVSEWIGVFSEYLGNTPGNTLNADTLRAHEGLLTELIIPNIADFDSLWQSGYFLREYIGDSLATNYRTVADSALDKIDDRFMVKFSSYSLGMVLPGQLTATNGITDSSQMVKWTIVSEYFLTEDYEMWAESKTPNIWAWILSGAFLLFVITGITMRRIKKG